MEALYVRLTPTELTTALVDPHWAFDLTQDLLADTPPDDANGMTPPGRALSLHKAWHGIKYLLDAAGAPVDVVLGGTPLSADDWGYGPPRYLTPDQVGEAAAFTVSTPWERIAASYDAARMLDAEIYPEAWDDPTELDWLHEWYEPLPSFLAAAARNGDALLLWLA